MSAPNSACPHINIIGDYTKEDIIEKQESQCDSCHLDGPNLWVCLHRDCLYVGCNESSSNHCVKHFQKNNEHSLFLNLSSLRVYCLICECEVFLENNDPPLPGMLPSQSLTHKAETESEDELENEESLKPKGLTGLQNLGNTCYMNSAIQALSNCPQLTNFFLNCGTFVRQEKKPALAKSYLRLMKEMWHKKRPSYVVPSGIAYGIKLVCPVFRGFTQQDAQEFLRCFMDQLHEELKEPVLEISARAISPDSHEELDIARADSGIPASEDSSQSDAEYETCDSGLSSEKASCVEERLYSSQSKIESPLPANTTSELSKDKPALRVDKSIVVTDNSTDFTDKSGSSSTDLSLKLSATDSDCQVPDKFISIPNSDEQLTKGNETNGQHFSDAMLNRDDCISRESVDMNEVVNGERLDSEKRHGNFTCNSSRKKSYGTKEGSQQKLVNSHSLVNSILDSQKPPAFTYRLTFRSVISDIFDGKLLSSVQCLTCDTVSTTKETFQDLSLPIPNRDHLQMIHASQGSQQKSSGTCTDVYSHQGWFSSIFGWVLSWFWGPSVSLQDCLSAFFSADELKGDNMYSCEKCKKLRNGIKFSKVIELPEILCIHLKRFRHEVMFSSKISSYVSFPLEGLDMSPFLHKSYPRGNTTYDLSSVICHHGTAGSGHYTAYSLNYLNDQWYEFDDQYVTAVDADVVKNCEAYVLFYRKCGDEMIKKRLCAVELMERSQNEHGLLKFHISKQWINKFNNFAEPGPISNTDFLCVHGGVPPHKAAYADELCTVLPQAVWEYLHDTFGGGPPCTHLYICPICQAEQDRVNQRKKKELQEFLALNAEFQQIENPSIIYALSVDWFKVWEDFVSKGGDIPSAIDNSPICYIKNNQPVLKLGSDYCSVSKEMYQYLHRIYGGGPEITLQPNTKLSSFSFTSQSNSTHEKVAFTPSGYAQAAYTPAKVNLSSHSHTSSSSSGFKNGNDQESKNSSVVNEIPEKKESISALKHAKL